MSMNKMSMAPRSTAYKWWAVFMLWFVCVFNYADRQSIFSVFPRLRAEFMEAFVKAGLPD